MKKLLIIIVLAFVLLISLANWYIQNVHVAASEDVSRFFNNKDIASHFIDYRSKKLRYVYNETDSSNLVLFVHGAPGSWKDFKQYLEDETLSSHASLVAIDRFGYGASESRNIQHSISFQADAIQALLDQYRFQNIVLVGHSFGGPVIGQLAAQSSAPIRSVIMLCPVNDPYSEKEFWFNNILNAPVIRSFLSDAVFSAVQEKIHHATSLKMIENKWNLIKVPVHHLHSENDWIAPSKENIAFSRKHIKEELLTVSLVPGKSHFIPWNDFENTKALILDQFLIKD